jgi:hypothetical protein
VRTLCKNPAVAITLSGNDRGGCSLKPIQNCRNNEAYFLMRESWAFVSEGKRFHRRGEFKPLGLGGPPPESAVGQGQREGFRGCVGPRAVNLVSLDLPHALSYQFQVKEIVYPGLAWEVLLAEFRASRSAVARLRLSGSSRSRKAI